MQRLNLFRLIIFLSIIIVASLFELNKDYEKYQAKKIEKNKFLQKELVQKDMEFN